MYYLAFYFHFSSINYIRSDILSDVQKNISGGTLTPVLFIFGITIILFTNILDACSWLVIYHFLRFGHAEGGTASYKFHTIMKSFTFLTSHNGMNL
jgi:hypothetical protein